MYLGLIKVKKIKFDLSDWYFDFMSVNDTTARNSVKRFFNKTKATASLHARRKQLRLDIELDGEDALSFDIGNAIKNLIRNDFSCGNDGEALEDTDNFIRLIEEYLRIAKSKKKSILKNIQSREKQ